MRAPINSEKHIVQTTLSNTTAPAEIITVSVVNVVDDPVAASADQVSVGTEIRAVWIELWVLGTSQQPATTVLSVEKRVAGAAFMTYAQSVAVHSYPNKKNIFYTTMGLVGDANANPTPLIRQWIKIPKGKQRFGKGDALILNVSGITDEIQICGQHIFKAYT